MLSKELIKANLKHLNGFLPIYKPKNICSNKLLNCIRNELYFNFSRHDISIGKIDVSYARHLETHASGILTFILGHGNYRRRNFVHAEYEYKLKIEFGIEREFNTIDGEIIERSESIDNVTIETINDALQQFQGDVFQKKTNTYFDRDLKTLNLNCDNNEIVQSLYRLMPMDNEEKEHITEKKLLKKLQKYPYEQPLRPSTCYLKLTDFVSPYGWFDVISNGSFSTRQFVSDFAKLLNTKASQVELTRIKEGPIRLNDLRICQFHEHNLDIYLERIKSLNSFYDSYIKLFDNMFDNQMSLRCRIK